MGNVKKKRSSRKKNKGDCENVIVMDEVAKEVREGVVKVLLYAHDLVLLGDNCEEVESRYS